MPSVLAHLSDEFTSRLFLGGLLSSEPASASPADTKYAAELAQLRPRFKTNTMNGIAFMLWLV